jgi:hypothetical protein
MVPSFHTIIVSFLSAVQAISSTALSIIHIYKRTVHTIKKVHNSPPPYVSPQSPIRTSSIAPRDIIPMPSSSTPEFPSTPSTPSPSQSVATSVSSRHANNAATPPPPTSAPPHHIARPSLLLLAELLSLPARFSGAALLFICDALITVFASFLDRYAPIASSRSLALFLTFLFQSFAALPLHVRPNTGPNYCARERHQTRAISQWLSGIDPT